MLKNKKLLINEPFHYFPFAIVFLQVNLSSSQELKITYLGKLWDGVIGTAEFQNAVNVHCLAYSLFLKYKIIKERK